MTFSIIGKAHRHVRVRAKVIGHVIDSKTFLVARAAGTCSVATGIPEKLHPNYTKEGISGNGINEMSSHMYIALSVNHYSYFIIITLAHKLLIHEKHKGF